METQATGYSVAHKVLAVFMSVVLAVGLSPMLPYGASEAYADDNDLVMATVELADGTYTVAGLKSSLGMYHFDAASAHAVVKGDKAWLVTSIDGAAEPATLKRFVNLAYGSQSEILDKSDTTNHTLVEGTPTANVTEELDADGKVSIRTFALPIEKSVLAAKDNIYYMIQYAAGYSAAHDGDWYAAKESDSYFFSDYTLEKVSDSTDLPVDSVKTVDIAVTRERGLMMSLGETSKLETVGGPESSNYAVTLELVMGSESLDKAFVGRADQAKAAEDGNGEGIIEFNATDSTFLLPVAAFASGEPFIVSFRSKAKAEEGSDAWYNRKLVLDKDAGTLYVQNSDPAAAAKHVADLIDAIYVQARTATTDADCAAAKDAWDALAEAEKELVEGKEADPDYFGRDTGDASKDDSLNTDNIGSNEILVVSFGTSFNNSRVEDISAVEKAIQAAFPDWAVRRAFTSQIIINHIQARDNEKIDNIDQALERAVDNGVKNLVVAPTHLMQGIEYNDIIAALDGYKDKMNIAVADPLLGKVGADEGAINADKEAVAKAITDAAVAEAGYATLAEAKADGAAFVFMGHGTDHNAKITYAQMQTQMGELGYENVFIGTVEGKPETTECSVVIGKVAEAGYKKVILRPLMVVAGDHANNDMADPDDPESWISQFTASEKFESVIPQIHGLGGIPAVQQLYVKHVADTNLSLMVEAPAAATGLAYTGAALTGVSAGKGYTLSGTTSATDAGTYTATAKLDSGYQWSDGTTADKTVTWTIAAASISGAKVTLDKDSGVYNGKDQKGTVKSVALGATTLKSADYKVDSATGKKAGSYVVTVTGQGNYTGTATATYTVTKATAKAKVTKSKTFKKSALKKKAGSFTAIKLTTDGKASWKVVKNSNKKVVSFKAGKVIVKKGAKKGKYTLQVKASAKAGANYAALAAKTYKITVTVK